MLHKPMLKSKELRRIRDGLAKPKFQPILSGIICLVLLHDVLFDVLCNVLVGDLKCMFVMYERSPPHLYLYLSFFYRQHMRMETLRLLQRWLDCMKSSSGE